MGKIEPIIWKSYENITKNAQENPKKDDIQNKSISGLVPAKVQSETENIA